MHLQMHNGFSIWENGKQTTYLIAQRLPMRPINQGDHAARCFGRTAVILTVVFSQPLLSTCSVVCNMLD